MKSFIFALIGPQPEEVGAEVHATDMAGYTALHLACHAGHVKVVQDKLLRFETAKGMPNVQHLRVSLKLASCVESRWACLSYWIFHHLGVFFCISFLPYLSL